jgi:4-amino-4-deoxy-L-arabinose transferase-like glycosyltransferase
LCLFLFCWRLGDARLFDLDEGIYVSSARNMAITGDFVTPRLNSRPHNRPNQALVPFFEKPILVYWLSAASLRTFGISEGAARVPVALASLLATLAVTAAGWRWFGRRAGLLAGLVYATVPMTVLDARQMTTDALLVLWFLLAMFAFVTKRPILFWIACALAVLTKGIIGLLLPGLVIGCYHAVVWFLVHRRKQVVSPLRAAGKGRALGHVLGVCLFLAIVVPWHVAIARAGGRDLNNRTWVQEYIIFQHVGRFKGLDKHHNAPLPTYIAYFLIGFFPWACFVPFALSPTGRLDGRWLRSLRNFGKEPPSKRDDGSVSAAISGTEAIEPIEQEALPTPDAALFRPPLSKPSLEPMSKEEPPAPDGDEGGERAIERAIVEQIAPARQQIVSDQPPRETLILFLNCWFWTIFLFFSASAAKLPTYIVPLYPAAALLVGTWFDRQLAQKDRFRLSKGLKIGAQAAVVTAALLAIVAQLIPVFTRNRAVMPLDAVKLAQGITLILAFGCIAAWWFLRPTGLSAGRLRAGIFTLAATMTLVAGAMAGPGCEVANRWIFGPYQDLARIARGDAKHGIPVIYYAFGDRRPSMLFYAADYSPIERKETPLLPFLLPYLPKDRPTADIITLKSTFDQQLKSELEAAGWRSDRLASRDSGIAVWYLLRIKPKPALP